MIHLTMRRSALPKLSDAEALQKFAVAKAKAAASITALLSTLREEQAKLFAVDIADLRFSARSPYDGITESGNVLDCEIFVGDKYLIVLSLENSASETGRKNTWRLVLSGRTGSGGTGEASTSRQVTIYAMGSGDFTKALDLISDTVENAFSVKVAAYFYTSKRFDEIRSEVTTEGIDIDGPRLLGATALADTLNRTLATAIKSSGGLLLADAGKQLPKDQSSRMEEIRNNLIESGIVSVELVVICSASNSQVVRINRAEDLDEFSRKGLKCACGKQISDEQPQELLTITANAAFLIDKSRWMSILLKQQLVDLGVPSSRILIEAQLGGDEIDCIADISGEIVMFELKDKEFSLGNAYPFGAKMGFIRPNHAIVVTTSYVGGDVKGHFKRTKRASSGTFESMFSTETSVKVDYIEGIDGLAQKLSRIVSDIHNEDCADILSKALRFITPSTDALMKSIQDSPES